MSRGFAMIGLQQSAQTLDADDLTLMTFMLRLGDLVDALVNPFVMIVLEVRRTVRENGRRGTDHGAAAPVFLVGGVAGGLVGTHPSLVDLDNGALRFHTDFRRVYATVLDRWLGFDSQAVLGARFEPLDILKHA